MKLENERKVVATNYINRDPYFIVPKMLYFLLNWLVYSTHSFLFQFIGLAWDIPKDRLNLSMVFQIFNFFGAMYWGSLADRTRKYKLIAAGCVIVNSAFVCAMAFPLFEGNMRFAYYCLITAGQCFFSAGTFPMIDAIVLSILEADPSAGKDLYGSQKAFGTIAHNITTFVVHHLYEVMGQDFFVMYYSTIGSMLALTLSLLYGVSDNLKIKAHKHHGPSKKATEDEEPVPQGSSTIGLLKKPSFFIFLLSILAAGIVRSVNTNNHSVYMTDYLKADKKLIGDMMVIGRLAPELLLLFFAKTIMGYLGPYWFLILGQLSGVIRIILYLFLKPLLVDKRPYIILVFIIEMLKGVNSSLVSAGAFRIASDLAPAAWGGAAQTLVAGVWQGVSMLFAAIIASAVLGYCGSDDENLFYVFTVTAIIGSVSFVFIFFHYSVTNNMLFAKKK